MRRPLAALLVALAAGCAGPGQSPPAPEPAFVAAREATPAGARCDACGERLPDPAWRWPDGRRACEGCRQDGVTSRADAEALLGLAREDLRRVVGLEPPADATLRLELVDARTLAERAGSLAHPRLQALTVAGSARGAGGDGDAADGDDGRTELLVLLGLPRPALRGVLAHELVHATQLTRGATRSRPGGAGPEPAWLEGSALWVHARVLRDVGAGAWAARLADPEDPETGGALRRFDLVVQALGQAEALRLATTTPRFPAGHGGKP